MQRVLSIVVAFSFRLLCLVTSNAETSQTFVGQSQTFVLLRLTKSPALSV